ncbi:hypothetical protein [Bacillus pseudomycoides]|uniref:hypothetical protein n=1 Tax=Bacillus pseudomycoides TaxID=64104 RepID=UPI003CF9FA50
MGKNILIVDTIPASNEYGYKFRLLAIWDDIKKKYRYDFDGIANVALYLDLDICWSYNR